MYNILVILVNFVEFYMILADYCYPDKLRPLDPDPQNWLKMYTLDQEYKYYIQTENSEGWEKIPKSLNRYLEIPAKYAVPSFTQHDVIVIKDTLAEHEGLWMKTLPVLAASVENDINCDLDQFLSEVCSIMHSFKVRATFTYKKSQKSTMSSIIKQILYTKVWRFITPSLPHGHYDNWVLQQLLFRV